MNRRALIAAAAGCVGLAALAGWLRPLDLPVGATGGGAGQWRLPGAATLERSPMAEFAQARALGWVGTGGGNAAAAEDGGSSEWTLLGLVGRSDDRAILVQAGNDPLIKRLGAGDTLPDGSRLVSVGSDGIVIERDGCQSRRPLYPVAEDTGTDPAASDCLPPGEH
jgi:hypothetical protein